MDHVLQEAGTTGKYLDTDEAVMPHLCMLMSYTGHSFALDLYKPWRACKNVNATKHANVLEKYAFSHFGSSCLHISQFTTSTGNQI